MKHNLFRIFALVIIIGGLVLAASPVNADDKPAPTEIVELRTENTKTFDNHDGTRGLDSYIGTIHYKDDYASDVEQWKDIDTTIVNGRVDKAPYTLSIDYSSKIVTIKDKKTGSITTIGLNDIDGEVVKLDNPVESGNSVKFQDIAKDTDVVIEATNTHVRFKRVLKSSDAPLMATFAIYQQGDGITVTPMARQNGYADVKVDSKIENGVLTETIAKYEVGDLTYPIEVDPSIDVRVSASTDDTGYIFWNGSAWTTYGIADTVSYVGCFNTVDLYKMGGGLRFQGITIPQSSTISNAYINVTPSYSGGAGVNATICAQLGNAPTFSTLADFQARRGTDVGGANNTLHTVNFTYWNNIAAWSANATTPTTSFAPTLQEVVNATSWQAGYNLVVFLDDFKDRTIHTNTTARGWYTYDFIPATAPLLHVDYTVNNATMNTLRCTGFGDDWLLLNGNVTAYGGPINITQLGFDYGTTTAYGQTIETTYTNYTLRSYGYYQYLSGLNTATLYNFRANSYNGAGWGYGPNRSFSTGGTSVEWPWEVNANGVNTTQKVYGSNWAFQRFTTNVTAHTLSSIDLWLQRNGSPGDITVITQSVGIDGLPYGAALNTGTIAAQYTGNLNPLSSNTTGRYNIKFDKEISLLPNTQYAVTVKALMGDNVTNYLMLGNGNSTAYTYGSGYTSNNNGVNWVDTGTSFLFDLWGRGCLQVDDGKVFQSYKAAGDWLFVFSYNNVYPPYYPIQDSKQNFAYQLVDYYNTVKAQSPCNSWGYRPGSIYLSAATVATLQWGGAYRIRLINLRDGTVYMEYPIQSVDWLGADMTLLDSWCLSLAQKIGIFYNSAMTTTVAGKGVVLNPQGGVMFSTGIPLLDTLRSNLFQVAITGTASTTNTYPQNMRQAYQPALILGADAYAAMTSIGNLVGVDGRTVGFAGLLVVLLILAGWGFQPGHSIAATIISSIVFILAMLTGLLDLLIGALLLAIAIILLVWQTVFRGG